MMPTQKHCCIVKILGKEKVTKQSTAQVLHVLNNDITGGIIEKNCLEWESKIKTGLICVKPKAGTIAKLNNYQRKKQKERLKYIVGKK